MPWNIGVGGDRVQCFWLVLEGMAVSNPIRGLEMPLGLQEAEAPRISRKSAYNCGELISPKHRLLLPPQEIFLLFFSVRNWAKTRAIVWQEVLSQGKIPMTPSWFKPAAFRACSLVPQPNVSPPDEVRPCTNFLVKWVIAKEGLGSLGTTHLLSLQRN